MNYCRFFAASFVLAACSAEDPTQNNTTSSGASGGGGGGGGEVIEPAVPGGQEPTRNPSLGARPSDNPGGILLHSGEVRLTRTDLSIQGRSLGFKFVRTYRSRNEASGTLGYGWDANVFMHVEMVDTKTLRLHDGTGRSDVFTASADGRFFPPAGSYAMLRQVATGFEHRTSTGTITGFNLDGTLARVRSRQGDTIEYGYNEGTLTTITDEFGRVNTLKYDTSKRLVALRDFTGREVNFTYTMSGDLHEVRSPIITGTVNSNDFPAGRIERYGYDEQNKNSELVHNLVSIIAPNEVADGSAVPWLVTTYGQGGAEFDRAVTQIVGGSNASGVAAGGTLTFGYDFTKQTLPAASASKTTVTDRRGFVTEYYHDVAGHCVAVDEHIGATIVRTSKGYSAQGELIQLTRPLGNSTTYGYDDQNADPFQRGNLLSQELFAGAIGGDQTSLRTTYSYEPIFNQVRSITAASGNDPKYIPDNGGQTSAARYTTTYEYDYQEAATAPSVATDWKVEVPAALLNLGDRNGDGATAQALGNPIRSEQPKVQLIATSHQALAEQSQFQVSVNRLGYDEFGQLRSFEDARGNIDHYEYYPEADPDGDGMNLTPGKSNEAGGYLARTIVDAVMGPNRKDAGPALALMTKHGRDARGNVIAKTDPRGLTVLKTYSAVDELLEEEAPKIDASQARGYLRRFRYDANGNVVEKAFQNVTTDPVTHLPKLVSAHEYFTNTFSYDLLNQLLVTRIDAWRDPLIPVAPAIGPQPELLTTTRTYDASSNLVREESPLATLGTDKDHVALYSYDERDRLISVTRGGTGPLAATHTLSYDDNDNRVSDTDAANNDAMPGGELTSMSYDGFDRLLAVTDVAKKTTNYLRDPEGRVRTVEEHGPAVKDGAMVLLRKKHMLFDERGRGFQTDDELFVPTGVLAPGGVLFADGALTPGDQRVTERTEYDANSRQTFRIEDNAAVVELQYDGADRIRRTLQPVVDATNGAPVPGQIVTDFDGNGNPIRVSETIVSDTGTLPPKVLTQLRVYDAVNRLVRDTNAAGRTSYVEYDSRNNVVSNYDMRGPMLADPLALYTIGEINGRGNATRYVYDGNNRRWLEVSEMTVSGIGGASLDPANPRVTVLSEYDANGRLVAKTDDAGRQTTWAYDSLDRMSGQTNADGGSQTWQYDADGNAVVHVDENGSSHASTFDARGLLLERVISISAGETLPGTMLPVLVGTTTQKFAYDGMSKVIESTDENEPADPSDDATVITAYDSLGRVLSETQNGRSIAGGYVGPDRVELRYPNASTTIATTYDARHLVRKVESTRLGIVTESPYDAHQPPPRVVAGPLEVTHTYTADDLVETSQQTVTTLSGTSVAGFLEYTHSSDGAVDDWSETATPGSNNAFELLFHLNFANSLRQVESMDVTTSGLLLASNPQLETVPVKKKGGGSYDGGGANTAFMPNGMGTPTTDGQQELDYPSKPHTGIRIADGAFVYQWDVLNRLRVVRRAADPTKVVAQYSYDASAAIHGGRRTEKIVSDSGTLNGATHFYYDGANAIEETDASGKVRRQFIYSHRSDELYAMDVDTNADGVTETLYYYLRDRNNNTTQLYDRQGNAKELYGYSFDGAPRFVNAATMLEVPSSLSGNPYLFQGQRYDAETGHYYFKARYYDPKVGVYISRDPLGQWGDSNNFGNGEVLVNHDPWNKRDPSGLVQIDGEGEEVEVSQGEMQDGAGRNAPPISNYIDITVGASSYGCFSGNTEPQHAGCPDGQGCYAMRDGVHTAFKCMTVTTDPNVVGSFRYNKCDTFQCAKGKHGGNWIE